MTRFDRLLTGAHTVDEDCFVDPDTHLCIGCGVEHGDPCPYCQGRAYHYSTCPCMLTITEADPVDPFDQLGRLRNWNPLTLPLGLAIITIAFAAIYGVAYYLRHQQ